jgi:hypothetical protein
MRGDSEEYGLTGITLEVRMSKDDETPEEDNCSIHSPLYRAFEVELHHT